MASGVFGLKKVYKRQVENINNGNFTSWTEDFSDAYIMAGQAPGGTNKSSILRINYINEIAAVLPSSILPASNGLTDAATVSNYNYGYYGGGRNSENNIISRLDFATELNSLPGTNLPTNLERAGAISRVDYGYGYFIGGRNPAIAADPRQISTITRLDFSTETLSPMPNLPAATQFLRGFNGTTYGYSVGGDTSQPPVAVNTISRLDFSNNTLAVSLPGKNLTTPRTQFVANESPLYGYASAGNSPSNISTIERLDFSTENTVTLSTLAPFSGTNYGGFSSLIGGYMMTNNAATTNRLNFSNETFQTGLAFFDARQNFAAVNARHKRYNQNTGTAAYVNQGLGAKVIDKFFYQTETWTASIASTPVEQAQTGGAASNTYGYIFGGRKGAAQVSNILRIDFSNDTNSSGGGSKSGSASEFYLPSSVDALQDAGVTQTNSYAYYIGGNQVSSSSIFRMDFFTENFDRRGSLPASRGVFAPVKSANTGYLIANADSTVYRLDFSNETLSTSLVYPLNLTRSPDGYAYNQLYGYFLGGTTVGLVDAIYRLNFSNDTFSLLSQNTPAGKNDTGGGCSSGDAAAYLNSLQDGGSRSTVHRLDFSTEVLTQLSPSPASREDSVAVTNANT